MAGIALAGCKGTADALAPKGALSARENIHQGYVFDQQALDFVPVGSSREQVLLALGTPTTTATFDNEVFYYISQQRIRRAAFAKPKLVDQRILAVYFGADGRVENIAAYGMNDGKVFDFVRKVTPTGGKDQTFIGQILSGLGSKSAPKLPGAGG
ncbi:MAG: outer membrane protein assembly factor BamE [Phyllobacteriaceae bacterium]|nr:outer membrane protein assembly factor BamE [Phyllobacteriaceae bacterium]